LFHLYLKKGVFMNKKLLYYFSLLFCLLLAAAVATAQQKKSPVPFYPPAKTPSTPMPDVAAPPIVHEAVAAFIPGATGQQVQGLVSFTLITGGVRIVGNLSGLKPGEHAMYVHENGDCSNPTGNSMGGIFNPSNARHGSPDAENRQEGALGNITVDSSGEAHFSIVDKTVNLTGVNSIVGRALVIHANADDFKSQPAGDAGAPVACAVIGIVKQF
jgi:Cu/Zn superoxide dismutase